MSKQFTPNERAFPIDNILMNISIYILNKIICRVNPIDYSWETHLFVPKIRIEGNYHMQGRILVIPLNGHGKCWFEPSKLN